MPRQVCESIPKQNCRQEVIKINTKTFLTLNNFAASPGVFWGAGDTELSACGQAGGQGRVLWSAVTAVQVVTRDHIFKLRNTDNVTGNKKLNLDSILCLINLTFYFNNKTIYCLAQYNTQHTQMPYFIVFLGETDKTRHRVERWRDDYFSSVPRQQCSPVSREKCESVPRRVEEQKCFSIPRQTCQPVEQEVGEERCRPVARQQCGLVPSQSCQTVSREECSPAQPSPARCRQEPRQQQSQSCRQIPRQQCSPPAQQCRTVQQEKCLPVCKPVFWCRKCGAAQPTSSVSAPSYSSQPSSQSSSQSVSPGISLTNSYSAGPASSPQQASDDYGSPVSSPLSSSSPTYSSPPASDDYGSPVSSPISSNDVAAPSPSLSPSSSNADYVSPVSSPLSSSDFTAASDSAVSSYDAPSAPVSDSYGAAPASSSDFNSFSSGPGQSLEPSSYVAVTDLVSEGEGSIIPSSSPPASSSFSDYEESPAPVTEQASDLYGAPVSDIFTGTEPQVVLVESADNLEAAAVYNTIDTNSLESGFAPDVFTPSVQEETPVPDSYGSPVVEEAAVPAPDSYLPSYENNEYDEVPSYDFYSNQDYLEDLPSYVIPSGDSFQAAPSISIEYASPRDELRRNDVEPSLVIDLTPDTQLGEAPQFGQRLGSQSKSSHLLAKSRRHRRRWVRWGKTTVLYNNFSLTLRLAGSKTKLCLTVSTWVCSQAVGCRTITPHTIILRAISLHSTT